jgi:hypothetical protein
MADISSHAGVLGRRTFRITLVVVAAIALLWFGLMFVERGGPSPVHNFHLIGNQNTTTTIPGATTTTVPMGGNGQGQNCNDNDQHTGEGTPEDILADDSNGNGNGGDGCPSGI